MDPVRDIPSVAWLAGRVVAWEDARVPIEDRGLQFAESLYEVLPITAGRARLLPAHVERMRRAARELDLEPGVPDLDGWQRVAAELVSAEGLDEGLLYAQVTGGVAPRSHVTPENPAPTFFAYLQRHRFPRADEAARGIRAITVADLRWARCDLKTTMLVPAVLAKREAVRQGVDEALLRGPDGEVREGSTSNVFIVEGNRIVSPAPAQHVLPGVTRSVVSELALEEGLPVTDEAIPLERLLRANEVFITSTSRLVMPVLAVDSTQIGAGAPGPITLELARRLRIRLEIEAP